MIHSEGQLWMRLRVKVRIILFNPDYDIGLRSNLDEG